MTTRAQDSGRPEVQAELAGLQQLYEQGHLTEEELALTRMEVLRARVGAEQAAPATMPPEPRAPAVSKEGRSTSTPDATSTQLGPLEELRERGVLTDEQFANLARLASAADSAEGGVGGADAATGLAEHENAAGVVSTPEDSDDDHESPIAQLLAAGHLTAGEFAGLRQMVDADADTEPAGMADTPPGDESSEAGDGDVEDAAAHDEVAVVADARTVQTAGEAEHATREDDATADDSDGAPGLIAQLRSSGMLSDDEVDALLRLAEQPPEDEPPEDEPPA